MAMRIRTTRRERLGLNPSEHTEAVRFMRVVKLHEPRLPALKWLHAVPNGGFRNDTVAKKMKAEGVRRGVHDYCWPYRRGEHAGLYLELKSLNGCPTKEQRAFGEFVAGQGFKVVYAKGWEEAWAAVAEYAGLPSAVNYAASAQRARPRRTPTSCTC